MKKKYYILSFLILLMCTASCSYLDLVPEEITKDEDTYSTPQRLKEFLASCYSFQPANRALGNAYHIMCAEEVTSFRKETFSTFNEGTYGPTDLQMTKDSWGQVWQGINQCYRFLDALDKVDLPEVGEEELMHYRAEANFLIAYYHFISLRFYGPTLIMDKLIPLDMDVKNYPERSSYDEVVAFIDQKLEEALPELADAHNGDEYGRVTRYTALALRSRMYLYAASPLFNGNSEWYSDFKSPVNGRPLISQTYSRDKWVKAADVSYAAITELDKAGFHLYDDAEAGIPNSAKPSISNKAERRLRYSVIDYSNGNPEIIWADTRRENAYGLQRRSMPKQAKGYVADIQGITVPTLQAVEMFYTENGLPMEFDEKYDSEGRYDIIPVPLNIDGNNYSVSNAGMSTWKQHVGREPRFYAWIGFHGGYSEIAKFDNVAPGKNDSDRAIVLKLRFGEAQGRQMMAGMPQVINFSVTGYNNKKFCHPSYTKDWVDYPLVQFRLAEIYLNYAEALVELNELDKAKFYLNKVRRRAGIREVDDAWDNYSTKPGYQNTPEGLQEIVRQERLLELYMEGHKFFDVRRWKIAEKYLGVPVKGLNTMGKTDEEFFQVTTLEFERKFHRGQYLMPININEVQKIPQLVQNPYYN